MKTKFFLVALAGYLSACATPARQTEALLSAPRDIPEAHRISGVEFIEQTENFCGPSTLAMAMQKAGKRVPVDELAAQVYTPGKEGSLQQDMIGSARRQGMLAVQIHGLPSLLKEVSSGNPVIVFMNLGLTWYPIYHYAIVTGYDLSEPSVWMHSGATKDKEWSMRKFERSWALGKYWGLVILPVTQLAVTAEELEHSAAGAGLEAVGKLDEAEAVYFNILQRWPSSFGALIGMGNVAYSRKQFQRATNFLKKAVKAHPRNPVAWHNLAIAQGAAKERARARKSAARALELVAPNVAPTYRESLKEWVSGS